MTRAHLPLVLVFAFATAFGCSEPPKPPTGPSLVPATPPPPNPGGAFSIQGRITDVDTGVPIGAAVVTSHSVCYTGTPFGRCAYVDTPATTIADANGAFILNAPLPATWTEAMLTVSAPGYERLFRYVQRADMGNATLPAYPTVTIRPGESIEINLAIGIEVCGWLSVNCRRLAVSSSTGGSVDVEVTGSDSPGAGLHGDNDVFNDNNWPTVLTVSSGEVWVLGLGRVRLTARQK